MDCKIGETTSTHDPLTLTASRDDVALPEALLRQEIHPDMATLDLGPKNSFLEIPPLTWVGVDTVGCGILL